MNTVLALHSRELCGMKFSNQYPLRFIYKNYEKVIIHAYKLYYFINSISEEIHINIYKYLFYLFILIYLFNNIFEKYI